MKTYNKIISFFFIFFTVIVYSQTIIKGRVLDQDSKPVVSSNVILERDTKFVEKAITDSLGNFSFSVGKGDYVVKITRLGEKIYKKEIKLEKDLDLGEIKIDNSITLEGVTIDGRKKLVEHKIDRTVFNAEESGLAVGDAVEVLRATPGLQVTGDAIKILGSSGITGVMIDGRIINMSGEQLINYIRSIQSDQIKSIEVITTPPARYSAEGTSGIVNIVLKKQRTNTWSAGLTSSYKQAKYGILSESANFNYKKDKFSLTSNVNYNLGKSWWRKYITIEYPDKFFTSDRRTDAEENKPYGRIGLDYDITKKWSVGIIYSGFYYRPDYKSVDISKETTNVYKTSRTVSETIKNNSYNFHTTLKTDTIGGKINLDLDYFNFYDKNNQNFDIYKNDSFDSNNINNSSQEIDNYSINLDVDHPTRFAKLNYGTRFSFTGTKSKLYSDIKQVGFSQNDYFKYRENTQAFFASANKDFNEKFSAMLGMRLESTNLKINSLSTGENKKSSYTKFFPTVYFQYRPKEYNTLSVNYMRRINRPNFSVLNPFREYSSSFEYWQGNPELQPVSINRITISHGYKDFLHTSFQTEFVNDVSSSVSLLEDGFIKNTYMENVSGYVMGVIHTYTYNKKSWLKFNIDAYIGYLDIKSKMYPLVPKNVEGFRSGFAIYPDFKISKSISTGFDLTHMFPSKLTDLSINDAKTDLDIYAKIQVGDNWNISLKAKNLLDDKIDNSSVRNNNKMRYIYHDHLVSRSVMLSVNYKFGGKIKVNERNSKNIDEISRINTSGK